MIRIWVFFYSVSQSLSRPAAALAPRGDAVPHLTQRGDGTNRRPLSTPNDTQ